MDHHDGAKLGAGTVVCGSASLAAGVVLTLIARGVVFDGLAVIYIVGGVVSIVLGIYMILSS